MKDLEIRGAGNLLGQEQSGHIEAVGFDLYVEMLEQTVAELKGEKVTPKIDPVLDLKITAMVPEDYIVNPDLRLSLYRKIASAKDKKMLKNLSEELRDRFGTRLLEIMELKVIAKKLAITKILNTRGKITIIFAPETPVTPEKVIFLYGKRKEGLKLLPEGGIEINLSGKPWGEVFEQIKEVMEELGSP
jgi:transcription-repair coupling factor (superfamily II helicase)